MNPVPPNSKYDIEIVIPCYNEEEFLAITLESVVAAREKSSLRISILISDNCSKDNSLSIAKFYMEEYQNIRILTNVQNIGGRENWIKALSFVDAQYFMFLDAHDYISVDYFLEVEEILSSSDSQELIFMPNEYVVVGNSEHPVSKYEFQYNLHKHPKIRFWQLVFYLGHATEVHSIFPLSGIDLKMISQSKAYSFDQLLLHNYLVFYDSKYMKAPYFRRYKTVVNKNFSYVNSYGEVESRLERVSGDSGLEFSDRFLVDEIIQLSSSILTLKSRRLAKFFLEGKYFSKGLRYFMYRVVRKCISSLTGYKGLKNKS